MGGPAGPPDIGSSIVPSSSVYPKPLRISNAGNANHKAGIVSATVVKNKWYERCS